MSREVRALLATEIPCGTSRKWAIAYRANRSTQQPPPVLNIRKGCQHTRRLDTNPHGALRSKEAYPLQSSLQGQLPHGYSRHKPWAFGPTISKYNIPLPLVKMVNPPARERFDSGRGGPSVAVGRSGAEYLPLASTGCLRRSRARRESSRARARGTATR